VKREEAGHVCEVVVMLYDLCLFDLDGTLTESKEGITKSVQYALKQFGIDEPDLDRLTCFIGPPIRESFMQYYSFSTAEAEKAAQHYRDRFSTTGIFENALYPGVVDMLKELKSKGVAMAVATSKPTVFAEKIIQYFGIEQFFETIAGSELDGRRSKKGEVVRFCLDTIDRNHERRAVMIGDRKYDIIGAQETAIDSIGVLWGYGSREELESAGATMLTGSTEELCSLIL
jgi:phosphoglycolate phosphatase